MQSMPAPHPLSWKERQRQEREALILEAAEDVLVEKGYYEMSIDEIASRVGIAKGTVYLHFPSKEDLVVALFDREVQKLVELIETTIAPVQTARAKLEAILHLMYGELFNKRMRMLYSIYHSADLRKLFMEKRGSGCMYEAWEKLTGRITSLLEEGKAAGEFDPSIPTPVMRAAFFSLLSPKSYERLMAEEHLSPDELVEQVGRIYFKGIISEKKPEQ